MRLTDASVTIHPRNAWEALDLGVLMAARQRRLLMSSWAALTVPVFVLLSLVLWRWPNAAILLFWWLKPAFDRLPLYILSQSLFGNTPTLAQALRAWPQQARPNLFASLTWRRFSLARSFYQPAVQLEGLSGKALSQRIGILGRRDSSPAAGLTIVGMHLETTLVLGCWALLYLLIPHHVDMGDFWKKAVQPGSDAIAGLEHLANLIYVLVLCFWEPIYVACGFSLYLNRRTTLEAWDIELVLRRLRQRLSGSAYALLLALIIVAVPLSQPAWADDAPGSCPIPPDHQVDPKLPRLLNQTLTSKASHESISTLLNQPPFANLHSELRWQFGDETPASATGPTPSWLARWLAYGARLLNLLAQSFEVLLWASLFAALVVLVWRYRDWLATFVGWRPARKASVRAVPQQLFGLQISASSLPDDIAGHAERLWAEHPREALGLLYRGLLYRLLVDFELPLKQSNTESEVLALVGNLGQPPLEQFSRLVTGHWQNLAYGHRLPDTGLQAELCNGWRALFAVRIAA